MVCLCFVNLQYSHPNINVVILLTDYHTVYVKFFFLENFTVRLLVVHMSVIFVILITCIVCRLSVDIMQGIQMLTVLAWLLFSHHLSFVLQPFALLSSALQPFALLSFVLQPFALLSFVLQPFALLSSALQPFSLLSFVLQPFALLSSDLQTYSLLSFALLYFTLPSSPVSSHPISFPSLCSPRLTCVLQVDRLMVQLSYDCTVYFHE